MFTLNYAQRCMIYCNNSTIEKHTVERIDSHKNRKDDRTKKFEILLQILYKFCMACSICEINVLKYVLKYDY